MHGANAVLVVVVLEVVEGFEDGVLLHEDPAVEPPWEGLEALVVHVCAGRDGEDVIELFEGALFGFRHPEEDHHEGHDVRASVETEYTGGCHGFQHEG